MYKILIITEYSFYYFFQVDIYEATLLECKV